VPARLELLKNGDVATNVVVADVCRVGRSPDNDLVLGNDTVSWNHCTFSRRGGSWWVEDMRSRNGTRLNDKPVSQPATLADGDIVLVGTEVQLRFLHLGDPVVLLMLEDLDNGVQVPLRSDRFTLGATPCNLGIPGAEGRATLLTTAPGEVWLGIDADDRPLEIGTTFEVFGRNFRLSPADAVRAPTVEPDTKRYPYRVDVRLDGPTGAVAVFEDLTTGKRHSVTAETRATLLYVLAQSVQQDTASSAAERGWTPDSDVTTGVWGRGGTQNRLHVLIHRLRKELDAAGFDPWCLEKRNGYVRLRVDAVTV
jgi:hypothetical protein